MNVEAQNVRGSLDHDLLAVTDKIGGPFTPVGFYYRTMIRPRRAWPLYEKFLRNVAGLGKIDKHRGRERRYDVEHRRAEVLVIGGRRGRPRGSPARTPPRDGRSSLIEGDAARLDAGEGFEVVTGVALGVFEGGLVPVDAGNVLLRYRAGQIVVAAGAVEQPLVFPGNDLVGVVLPEAVRRLVGRWSLKPGERAVVVTADEGALDTVAAARAGRHRGRRGRRPARDARPPDRREGPGRAPGRGRARRAQGRLRPARHVRRPPARLRAARPRRARRSSTTHGRGIFVPTDLPDGHRGRRRGRRRDRRRRRPRGDVQRRREEGQVLRLHLRGRDRQGHEARHRRGLRLDRAGQALHDRDHGPVPGEALPRPLDPPLRARERDRRGDDRDDDRAPAVAAGRARPARRPRRTSRRSARPSTTATRSSARR